MTSAINRLRGLLVQIHPRLEKALGDHASHEPVLRLLTMTGGPDGVGKFSRARIHKEMSEHEPRIHARLADGISAGLSAQTATDFGASATDKVLSRLAAQIRPLRDQRAQIALDVEKILQGHLRAGTFTSMRGASVKIAARLLAEIGGDVAAFPPAAHLAADASLAPVTKRSSNSIHGEHVDRGGNNALSIPSFTSLRADPVSTTSPDRRGAEGLAHVTP